jgi:hypothetical protein
MDVPQDVEYTILLVFPGFGAEREKAQRQRVGEAIAVLALGVMQHHGHKNPLPNLGVKVRREP